MLAKHIAEIHNKRLAKVNEAINNNRNKFRDNVDIIDVKNSVHVMDSLLQSGIFSKQSISNATNIYLLSERGYAKLIKIFNDDLSWDLYDQLLDEYFELRDENSNVQPIHNKPLTQLELLQMTVNQLVESERKWTETNDKVLRLETEFNKEIVTEGYKSNENLARRFNLFSSKNKPHFGFIDAIAKHLLIYNTKIGYSDEYVDARREVLHGGTVGVAVYYSEKAIKLIEEFLHNEFKPAAQIYKRTEKKGQFNEASFKLGSKTYKFNEKTFNLYK